MSGETEMSVDAANRAKVMSDQWWVMSCPSGVTITHSP